MLLRLHDIDDGLAKLFNLDHVIRVVPVPHPDNPGLKVSKLICIDGAHIRVAERLEYFEDMQRASQARRDLML